MKPNLSVIVPCFNEEKNIPELIERTQNNFNKKNIVGEIILIDDGSTDQTAKIIQEIQKHSGNVKTARHETNRGIVAAWTTGLALCGGEYIALIDSDLQYLPEDIWRLYRETTQNFCDIAQGARSTIGKSKIKHTFLNKLLNATIRTVFNVHLRDPISSFIVCRKEILENLLCYRNHYHLFQILLVTSAIQRGYRVHEVEILFDKRLLGKTYFKNFLRPLVNALGDIIKLLFEFRIFYKPETVLSTFLNSHTPKKTDHPLPLLRRMVFNIYMSTMPLHHWMISKQAASYYQELKKSQWLDLKDMRELQARKLQKIINHAYYHVPYYRNLFDQHGIKVEDIRTIDDLQKIPFLAKQNVRENLYFDLFSDNHDKKRILKISTSGSTGEPFICYADKHQLEIRWASTLRSMEWTGYRFGDKQARLWHQTLGMSLTQVIRERIDAIFNRRLFIPAFEMSDQNIHKFVSKIKKFKPALIDGYAESFNFLARYLNENELQGLKLKGIMSSAQELPEKSRKIIEDKFNCRAFDKYGSREFSGIAYECEAHEGHHIVSESYIVEIMKDNRPAKPGEVGEVVVTDLNNFCMPMIRYRIGDIATAVDNSIPCPCGRGMPRIGKIEGRVQAIIVGSDGQYIPGTFFAHFFKDHDHIIRQYQVSQENLGKITLKIIKGLRFDQTTFNLIVSDLKKYIGKDLEIEIDFVEKIAMVRTGKHQGSVSRMKIDFQNDDRPILTNK